MGQPIPLRPDYDAVLLRPIARGSKNADQVRRQLALAVIYEGGGRTDAAESAASLCMWCATGCSDSTPMGASVLISGSWYYC